MIIRDANGTDAGAVGAILSGFIDDTPWMPRVHSRAEDLSFAGTMVDRGWVRIAARGREVVGFLTRNDAFIHALYLRPDAQGQGIGKALIDDAKHATGLLELAAFQANAGAIRFYTREGFTETARTDGRDNDEGLPDVQMRWIRPHQQGATS